jgi:hypothetical protein
VSDEIELAIRLLSNQATKEEIIELLSVSEYDEGEIQFLAAASSLLTGEELTRRANAIDIAYWGMHPDDAQSKGWELAGIACNPNLPNGLKDRMISELNPLALVRFRDEIKSNGTVSLPLLGNPDLREIFDQELSYQLIVDEAKARDTSEERLFQIYDQELWEYADKSPDPAFNDFVWYDDVRERLVFSQEQDERLSNLLAEQPILEMAAKFFAKSEGSPEFSYLRSEILANPNSLGARSKGIEQYSPEVNRSALNWYDLLREPHHPSLFRFLESMYVSGSGYEIRPHSWLALANRLARMTSHSELTAYIESVTEDEVLVDTTEIGMNDGEFDLFVEQIMPYLVGSNTEFLREAFEKESDAIKQAVALNPHCDPQIMNLAKSWNDDPENWNALVGIPEAVELARYAAYSGNYSLINRWVNSREQFDQLIKACDAHVADAIGGLRDQFSE